MQAVIGNWTLSKAAEDDKTVSIRMVANRLSVDKDNEQIIPQAFNKATVEQFLKTGIIDWHHRSITGKTQEERANAILGQPYDFQWENNLPVVYGRLTKAHRIVRDSIMPHLDAKQRVFGASVGGSVLKAETVVDPHTHKACKQICAIDWNHIAIAASPYVISPGSEVSMIKASGDLMVTFSDLSSFEDDFIILAKGEALKKALTVGANTNSASFTGVDAMRKQSLEGGKYANLIEKVSMGIFDGTIRATQKGVEDFLRGSGLSELDINHFLRRLVEVIRTISRG